MLLTLGACSKGVGGGGAYDPDAVETLGRVIARRDTGATTRQANPTILMPAGGLLIPVSMFGKSQELPLFEYKVKLDDGRQISIVSWYPDHPVDGCVKLFESPSKRSDYPRLINAGGCRTP